MASQRARYTCGVSGQVVTLTPKAGVESQPTQLAATTIVFNTVANPASAELWDATAEYLVTIEKVT